jgi:hypothetical protein
MNGKINQLFLLLLAVFLVWQWLGPHRRKELHRTMQIAAGVLLASACIAMLVHQYSS